MGFGGFGDIFDAFFEGQRNRPQGPEQGADQRVAITITFEEAVFGSQKEVKVSRVENCSLCHGLGSKPGVDPVRCTSCNGSGQIRRVQQSIFGRFTNITTCSRCRGTGTIITEHCPQCRGSAGRELNGPLILISRQDG